MKYYLILVVLFFVACESNSPEPDFDCANSDLSLTVVSSVKSDCSKPGSITVEAIGGKEEYLYSLNGVSFQRSSVFEDLFAGDFELFVKDENECLASIPFTLESEPDGISLSVSTTISECSNATGSITAQATGGVGILQFSLDGSSFSEENSFENVAAGSHEVSVMDEDGCIISKDVSVKTDVSLEKDIMPIIETNCAITNCHNGSRSPTLITNIEIISNAGRIKSETQEGSMPRGGTLSQLEIDLIACWADDGAPNN
ncbi:SprB repeat-containing protein [Ekhidna lutea]|uniref:SprB repeat-containing protein n=1 Tax=Ekhidna lutea TaxID=447679 RepID=A0A239LLX6_EKHLU|nr:hypothetical protein [Ekhidna lutea]SNT30574.1 SprB repeat-containing protein [Ekhidna lutea]